MVTGARALRRSRIGLTIKPLIRYGSGVSASNPHDLSVDKTFTRTCSHLGPWSVDGASARGLAPHVLLAKVRRNVRAPYANGAGVSGHGNAYIENPFFVQDEDDKTLLSQLSRLSQP